MISLNELLPNGFLRKPKRKSNSSLVDKDFKNRVRRDFGEFIEENNELDSQLFEYFESNIWPKFKPQEEKSLRLEASLDLNGNLNFLRCQIARQFREERPDLNWKNFKRLYNRWLR